MVFKLFLYGNPQRDILDTISKTLNEVFNIVGKPTLGMVEVHIFESDSVFKSHITTEAEKANVSSVEDLGFPVIHQCWTGIPKIFVSVERLSRYGEDLQRAMIEHEAGHAILHGSLEHYIVNVPNWFRSSIGDEDLALKLIYLASIAVKDSEVTELLAKKGFLESQLKLGLYMLKPSEDELIAKKLLGTNRRAKLVFAYNMLKPIAFTSPLRKYGKDVVDKALMNYIITLMPELKDHFEALSSELKDPSLNFQEDLHRALKRLKDFNKTILET